MHIFNLIRTYIQKRRQTRRTALYGQGQRRKCQSLTPRPAPATRPAKALQGVIILPTVVPMPQRPQRITAPVPRRRANYYAQLPPTTERRFPSNHARQVWKQQQTFQRWLWRTNRGLARELAKREGWVWE